MTYKELSAQVKKIQNRLWETSPLGNVSVLVGAGFSKNSISTDNKSFPNWSELAIKLLIDLYPDDNDEELKRKKIKCEVPAYILKLSQEYSEVFGQKELNNVIKASIPDNDFMPGELHDLLLSLPFKDIFTTNYDTLLDRASEKNLEKSYQVISTIEELSGSSSPRIIKLHGSFPNITPYVLTEEDYRQYPERNKPFINTVIQSLIENTLLLIGFSGDDPNFLNWIGWIRDELPDISQKIYICTLPENGNFSEAQKRLLLSRGIEILDLSLIMKETEYKNISDSKHYNCLYWFLNKLNSAEKKTSPKKWPFIKLKSSNGNILSPHKYKKEELINSIYKYLIDLRATYPGWILTPLLNRRQINSPSIGTYLENIKQIFEKIKSTEQNLILIDNIFWVKHLLMESLTYRSSNVIRSYVDKVLADEYDKLSEKYQVLLINIRIYLYIDARENLEFDVMDKYSDNLEKSKYITDKQKNWLKREKCLLYLKTGNYLSLYKMIDSWKLSENDISEDTLFYCSIFMELGLDDLVKEKLYNVLKNIRKSPKNDIYTKSIEGFCIFMIQQMDSRIGNSTNETERENFEDRLDRLEYSLCNPQTNIRDIKSSINIDKNLFLDKYIRKKNFDPFSYTNSVRLSNNRDLSDENIFINLFDYTPIYLRNNYYIAIDEKVISQVISNSIYIQPLNAISFMIRFRSIKTIESNFTRILLFTLSDSDFNILRKTYFESTYSIINELLNNQNHLMKNSYLKMLNILLMFVSYLIPRCNKTELNELMHKSLSLFKLDNNSHAYIIENTAKIIQRILLQKSYYTEENLKSITEYFNLPLPNIDMIKNSRISYPNTFIDSISNLNSIRESISINSNLISEIITDLKDKNNERYNYSKTRLILYLEYGIISKKYEKTISETLWKDHKAGEIPKSSGTRLWVPIKYRTSNIKDDDIDLIYSNLKDKFMNIEFDQYLIQPHSFGGMTELDEVISCILDTSNCITNDIKIYKNNWTKEDCNLSIKKLVTAWNKISTKVKEEKKESSGFGIQQYQSNLKNLINFYNICIFNKADLNNNILDIFKDMYESYSSLEIYLPELLLNKIDSINKKSAIIALLHSSNYREQNRAIEALIYFLASNDLAENASIYIELLNEIIEIIRNRRYSGLLKSLNLINFLLNKKVELFTSEMIKNILFGLERIELETRIDSNTSLKMYRNNMELTEIPDFRALASILTHKISVIDIDDKIDIQNLVKLFKNDVFPEVREIWEKT